MVVKEVSAAVPLIIARFEPCRDISYKCLHAQLVEIVMDLGRPPLARFPAGDLRLADDVISSADLDHAISKVAPAALDEHASASSHDH